MAKIAVAMSGGVDSSVAALLTTENGDEAIGLMMKLHDGESCGSADDAKDAEEVAKKLNFPFYLCSFKDEFDKNVIEPFIDDYINARTPNPCVFCNRTMKFGVLLKEAEKHGCTHIATGHYARIEYDDNSKRYLLKKGIDDTKDQSYMLYSLTQEQLAKTRFPLGSFTKEEVRKLAEEKNLVNAKKSESQDICFIPDGEYASFIEKRIGKSFEEGSFVGTSSEVYGKHKGIIHYTVGQRKGLGLSFPQPMFVKEINPITNEVVLSKNEELFSRELIAEKVNFIAFEKLESPLRVYAKIRYHHKEQPAVITEVGENKIKLVFDEAQRAITKGQSVVFYDDDIVLGGGIIV